MTSPGLLWMHFRQWMPEVYCLTQSDIKAFPWFPTPPTLEIIQIKICFKRKWSTIKRTPIKFFFIIHSVNKWKKKKKNCSVSQSGFFYIHKSLPSILPMCAQDLEIGFGDEWSNFQKTKTKTHLTSFHLFIDVVLRTNSIFLPQAFCSFWSQDNDFLQYSISNGELKGKKKKKKKHNWTNSLNGEKHRRRQGKMLEMRQKWKEYSASEKFIALFYTQQLHSGQ